jgi:hypothetical protein
METDEQIRRVLRKALAEEQDSLRHVSLGHVRTLVY